ncbi:MAG: UvrD-helicase domain-containing protein [Muribaculaceae bacterium]|nr:UvrD-helicase domain-containing protein [Muribaculaceae bacterium]
MLTVYKASAGSGKTYTLALRYISTLLGLKLTASDGMVRYVLNSDKYAPGGHRFPHRHRGILAITFTNKATAEMKERIIMQLNRLAAVPHPGAEASDTPYAASLTELFGCTRAELAQAAAIAVRELLCDYSRFNISTIDSFFQSVLRTFAREVNHQGDYAIQLDDSDAVGAGIGLMLDDINSGRHPSASRLKRWIDTLMAKSIAEGSRFNIFDSESHLRAGLKRFVEKMCGETFRRNSADMEKYLAGDSIRRLGLAVAKELDTEIPARCRRAAAKFRSALDAEGVALDWLKGNFPALLEKLDAGDVPDNAQVGTRAPAGFMKWLEWGGSAAEADIKPLFTLKNLPKSGKSPLFPSEAFIATAQAFAAEAREIFVRAHILSRCLLACYNLEFLGFASEYIDLYRRENNLILLSDTNELLRRIIKDEELPFIYERIGMTLTNLLIDEFQDTSVMQWENLRPLVANSLSDNHDNLIIGDVKQAIYRFRSSDSSMLDSGVEAEFPNKHETRGNIPSENTNYRSSHAVVRFNNTLFTSLSSLLSVHGYEGVRQALPAATAKKQGFVRVDFLEEGAEGVDASFHRMAEDILRQHSAGYRWRDIAILVRERSKGVKAVNYLMANYPEIPVISDEALLLDRSPAIQLILSMLRIVDEAYAYAGDSREIIEQRKYATRREINMMISRFNFYVGEKFSPEEALRKAVADAPEEAEKMHIDVEDVLRRRPANPTALVETIVATKLGKDLRAEEYVYIAAFQDVMESFFATHEGDIKAFLSWWNDHKGTLALASPPDTDAVSVMTIHKSKGLEWPCVHIPDCAWALSHPDPEIWYDLKPLLSEWMPDEVSSAPPMLLMDSSSAFGLPSSPLAPQYNADLAEQTADNLNITYVAFTRASNELIITCPMSVDSKGGETYPGVARALMDAFVNAETSRNEEYKSDPLTLPLSLSRGGEAQGRPRYSFKFGEPTAVDNPAPAVQATGVEAGPYEVVLRSDARELTSVEDALTEAYIAVGGEEEKEIADTPVPEEYSDERMRAAAERGTNIHNVLAFMRRLSDMPKAISYVGNIARISPDGRREIARILSDAVAAAGPMVEAWFGNDIEVMSEREIFIPGTGETFRPDRVVRFPDGRIEIVDYKFTSEPRPSHRRQVANYKKLISLLFPDAPVRGFLWYPELQIISEV